MPLVDDRVMNRVKSYKQWLFDHSHLILLTTLLLYMILQPFFVSPSAKGLMGMLIILILITSVYTMNQRRRSLLVAIALGAPFFISICGQILTSNYGIDLAYEISGLAFLGFTTIVLIRIVFQSSRVTADILFGAASIYLLFGFSWTSAYMAVETLQPGSFVGFRDPNNIVLVGRDLSYYSFVTLTTLGYGEITPVSPAARALATVEAVTGVLYLTFLAARLVAMYLIHSQESDSN